jgi:hypothetical protein
MVPCLNRLIPRTLYLTHNPRSLPRYTATGALASPAMGSIGVDTLCWARWRKLLRRCTQSADRDEIKLNFHGICKAGSFVIPAGCLRPAGRHWPEVQMSHWPGSHLPPSGQCRPAGETLTRGGRRAKPTQGTGEAIRPGTPLLLLGWSPTDDY